jgi:cyclic pyranopterin phosphate synthase
MIDITHKSSTLRKATAAATLKVGDKATINAIVNKTVPKGDVLEMAKTAGLFAVKKTAEMIPDCHPLPVEQTVEYE